MDIQQQQQWEVDANILKLNQHELREALLRICKTDKRENVGIVRKANLILADIAHRKSLETAGVHMALPPYQECPTAVGTIALKRCRKCKQDFVDEAGSRGGCSFHDSTYTYFGFAVESSNEVNQEGFRVTARKALILPATS